MNGLDYENFTDEQRAAVMAFYDNVCRRAEATMERTLKLEGVHYAAMNDELKKMKEATNQ